MHGFLGLALQHARGYCAPVRLLGSMQGAGNCWTGCAKLP